jgi:hypothetical protein
MQMPRLPQLPRRNIVTLIVFGLAFAALMLPEMFGTGRAALLAPNAPSNLVVTQRNEGVGNVTLNWADNSVDETGFKIEMRSGTGAWNQIKTAASNATSATGITVSATQASAFRVRASNASGDSAFSNEASAPIVQMNSPTTSSNVEPSNAQVSATATDAEGIARVEFYASATSNTGYTLLATDTTAPYVYDWANVPAGYHYVKAKAYDTQGSTTETLYTSFLVYARPTATIHSPSGGARFDEGADISINATAQALNSDEFFRRVDFYANTTLIGTVQGHYSTYNFTWKNVPPGVYDLTARPTTSNEVTGTSAPVQVTVGNPGFNISGRVTDGARGLFGVRVVLSGARTAEATTDASGDYVFTNVAGGAGYTVTPSASGYTFSPASLSFNNLSGSQTASFAGTPGASATPDPNAIPIYAQPSDGRAVGGPSSKIAAGQTDSEVADDFDLTASIQRVRVRGVRGGQNAPPFPVYYGVYVRFYEWADGQPGALQTEYYLPKGSPGVIFDAAQPSTFDITLPAPFQASGKHFMSVQPVFGGVETWWVTSGDYPNFRGATWFVRNNSAEAPAWTSPSFPHDISFDLYGTLLASPVVTNFSHPTIERSELLRIDGANFGAAQGASRLKIGGQTPHVIRWADNFIIAYVPESTALGSVPVEITTGAGTGGASINVTTRQPNGRIRWRFTLASDYTLHRSAVGPDGTVYVNDISGRLYALTPDGGLKWIFQAGNPGSVGPVTVGADGTIYVAGLVKMDEACEGGTPFGDGIFAVNPDGTQKWLFDGTCQGLLAGPNVGPDGKIYGVSDITGIGAFALTPAGQLAWNDGTFGEVGPLGKEIVFGPSAPGLPPTQLYFQFDQQVVNPQGQLFGYTLAGQEVFHVTTGSSGQPAVGPLTGNVFSPTFPIGAGRRLRSYTPQGAFRWQSSITPTSSISAPDVASDESAVYVIQDMNLLHALNPSNGAPNWTFDDPAGLLFEPVVSPDNRLVLTGGRITFGKPGFFTAVGRDGRHLWKQQLPDEPGFAEYGQVIPISRPRFAPDSQTAYAAADVAGDNSEPNDEKYSYFYALDTSANEVPVNEPPKVTITSPLSNSNVAKNTQINVTASVQDDGQVARVDFFYNYNGTRNALGSDTTAPYSVPFKPSLQGVYGIYAVATDTGSLTGESEIAAITVANSTPQVSWVSPSNGANFPEGSTITLVSRASDSDGGVTRVEFNSSLSGLIGADTTADAQGNYSVQFVNPPRGAHELYTWATDDSGSRTNSIINITVGPPPTPTPTPTPTPAPTPIPTPTPGSPMVTITAPADSTSVEAGTSVNVFADATDTDGGQIARVEFFRAPSGNSMGTDTTAPYNVQAQSASPDVWNVYAVATDDAGKTSRSEPVRIIWADPSGTTLSISGRIRHQQSSPENEIFLRHAHVELRVRNSLVKTTLTDSGGNYLFNNLTRGEEYTVRPAEPGYQFFPPSVTWSGIAESATWDFTAAGPLQPGPSPTPSPGASLVAWEKFYNSSQDSSDYDPRMAVDQQGNTYVAGTSYKPDSSSDTDVSTVKYSPSGEQLWARTWAGPGFFKDWASDVAFDSQGNVYVAVTSWGGSSTEYDMVVIKYDAGGAEKWVRTYNSPLGRWDMANALAVDGAGNVFVTGYSQMSGGANGGIFNEFTTVKYDAGGVEKWVSRITEERRGDEAVALSVDASGDVYATGFTWGFDNNVSSKNILTVKLSGASGQTLWKSRFIRAAVGGPQPEQLSNNPLSSEPGGLALDPQGNLYVYGSENRQHEPAAGSTEEPSVNSDYLLLKYNPSTGALVWDRNWAGVARDYARSIAIDSGGNVYLTGDSYDGAYESAISYQTSDAVTVKFDPSGNLLWERAYRGFAGKWDGGRGVVLDSAGNAYVGLLSEGFVNNDTAVIKYRPDGTEAWVYRYDNPHHSHDSLRDVATDGAGNVYLVGQAFILNGAGNETMDFVTFKLAASTANLNSPPDVSFTVTGPTIAGGSVSFDASGAETSNPTGPTIAGRTLYIRAATTDRDGTVARVDFFDGLTLIGSDTSEPFELQWNDVPEGKHAITAMAKDDDGATRSAKTEVVTVTTEPTPTPTPAPTPPPPSATSLVNHALVSNGGVATVSSSYNANYPASSLNNGDRRGLSWNAGGGWNDATAGSYPDWVEVSFGGTRTVSEVDVFTLQDNPASPSEPTEAQTFAQYGVTGFEVRYWDGTAWAVVPGASVSGNNKVWRKLTFSPISTSKIRVVVTGALAGYSRLVEVEAWGSNGSAPAPSSNTRTNVALSSKGGVVTTSSSYNANYPASSLNNGDRRGLNWNAGGGWNDSTAGSYPDRVEVSFSGQKSIEEIDIFTLQDNPASPSEPTEALTFTKYGVTGMTVEYWTGSAWATVPGGIVVSNDRVWRKLTFSPVNTSKIRVSVNHSMADYSRLVEIEAWQTATVQTVLNHALASNGGVAAVSSSYNANYPASSLNNGDRRGLSWNAGGGWNDATADAFPDWVEVSFNGVKSVGEVDVFTLQDNPASPSEPTEALTFTKYGVTAMRLEYWTGSTWAAVPGASVTGNDRVWRKFTFSPISTSKIRVVVTGALAGYSRLAEIEVY